MDITNPDDWTEGDIAVIRNQEARKVRDVESLIFETPIQHDYEEVAKDQSWSCWRRLVHKGGGSGKRIVAHTV